MTTALYIDEKEYDVELSYSPADYLSKHFHVEGDWVVVAYLSHDNDPINPLTDCDGQGELHFNPRARYGFKQWDDYYDLLGLDQYGSPKVDEDKLQSMWEAAVMKIAPIEFWVEGMEKGLGEELREQLAKEEVADISVWEQCRYAWIRNTKQGDVELDDETCEALAEKIEGLIDWDYDDAKEACWVGPDPYAVLVDCYEHGGVSFSVSGGGTRCRWDTSSGIAVWVPDKYAKEEIDSRVPVYQWGDVSSFGYKSGKKWYAVTLGKVRSPDFEHWHEAYKWLKECPKDGPMRCEDIARRIACEEIAEGVLEEYTNYCNGDSWGVIVDVFFKGELVEDDACWGYIGSDYAEEELERAFNYRVNWVARQPCQKELEV